MYYGHRTPWLFGAALVVAVAVVAFLFRVTGWLTAVGVPRGPALFLVFGGGILCALMVALALARTLS